MYLLVALFLIFQVDNGYADTERPGVKQTVEDMELFQNEAAETTDEMLGKTEDPGLQQNIFKAFEDILEYSNEIIRKLTSI